MKIGSLFSGIGGLELGLERATGGRTIWQVEQNEDARAVLAKHWPEARRYEDVRQVGSHNLEPVDIVCGGFPCQDISVAGKGAGLEGAQSGLWSEYARIVRELGPRFVVVENVAALTHRGMGRVLGDLAQGGYDAIWDCIPAAAVGAHHRRDRLFIVAYTNNQARTSMRGERAVAAGEDKSWRDNVRGGADDAWRCRSIQGARGNQSRFKQNLRTCEAWSNQSGVDRVVDGVPNRVDRLRGLGNAVVPQVAEVIGRVIVELEGQKG